MLDFPEKRITYLTRASHGCEDRCLCGSVHNIIADGLIHRSRAHQSLPVPDVHGTAHGAFMALPLRGMYDAKLIMAGAMRPATQQARFII